MEIPTTLVKNFNSTLTDLGAELAFIALKEDGFGSFQPYASRGFSPRELQAITRALSYPEVDFDADAANGTSPLRLRMTSPSHRSLLGIPLRYQHRVCGVLVLGRKDSANFSEKDRRLAQNSAGELEAAVAKSGVMASLVQADAPGSRRTEGGPEPTLDANATDALMAEVRSIIPYDRALLTRLEADSKLLVGFLSHTPGHFEWRQGQIFTLDGSAAGWVIRHRKPRLDRDLASTQGRFLDYKELYKDKFKAALVIPLRKGPELIGTITLATKSADLYHVDMARAAAGVMDKVARFLPAMGPRTGVPEPTQRIEKTSGADTTSETALVPPNAEMFEAREMMLRQERQAAIRELTGFLEQEIQRTLTKTRLELEDALADRSLVDAVPIGSLERVEQACRDLTRIETILNEILDNAKPLELHPRVIRIPDIIQSALSVITDEINQRRITVTQDLSAPLPPIKADESKLQQVFLSILKNALEAMTPGGHIHIEAAPHRGVRGRHEVAVTIQNDGAPIPTEHIGKIFEPGFTTKAAGTGLGLSSVKKIVEEHRGQFSIASGPGQGTTVIIRFPGHAGFRSRGRGRRRPRGR